MPSYQCKLQDVITTKDEKIERTDSKLSLIIPFKNCQNIKLIKNASKYIHRMAWPNLMDYQNDTKV